MLILIYGSNIFSAREKLKDLQKKFVEKNGGKEILVSIIYGVDFDLADFRNKALSAGFFAEKKMIVIKGLLENKNLNEEAVLEILERLSQDTTLIFVEKELSVKSTLGARLLNADYTFSCAPLSGAKLQQWIKNRARDYGAKINNPAIAELLLRAGDDMQTIDLQLNKLCSLLPDKEIEQSHIREIVQIAAEEAIFRLIDAIALRNKKLCLSLLEDKIVEGASALYILNFITKHFKTLLETKFLLEQGGNINKKDLAKEIGVHEFVAQKALSQVRNFHINEIKNFYREALKIEIAIKTGSTPALPMISKMLARL